MGSQKRYRKFYSMLHRNSNLHHSRIYAQNYRQEDAISRDDISHSGKCEIIRQISAGFDKPITVLDLGCGTGRYFHCVQNIKNLVGADCSINMLKMARNPLEAGCISTNIHLVQGSLYEIEFKPESFDLVICIGVFGALCLLDSFTLARIVKFLKPNGVFFFTVPEYLPGTYSWKGKTAKMLMPLLFGRARLYIQHRLKQFTMTERKIRKLLTLHFRDTEISRWQSPTGRLDLHCIARKGQPGS